MKAVVFATMTYGCESWTLNAESEKRIDAFEIKCYQKIIKIPYTAHRTNDCVEEEVVNNSGNHESLLLMIKKRKCNGLDTSYAIKVISVLLTVSCREEYQEKK